MYISRVEIDMNNRRRMKNLTHVGAFHDWVERSFPNEIEKQIRTRKLWRIDTLQGKNYLVLSVRENLICYYLKNMEWKEVLRQSYMTIV